VLHEGEHETDHAPADESGADLEPQPAGVPTQVRDDRSDDEREDGEQ
jgi:hypothetical protein